MKILIVGPSWVGDAVMSQALFKLLKENGFANKIYNSNDINYYEEVYFKYTDCVNEPFTSKL